MSVPLAEDLHKLSTYVTGTIRKNRKFLPQAFQNKFEVGEKKYFRKGPILAAFREKSHVFLCFSSATTARQKTHKVFVYDMANKNML